MTNTTTKSTKNNKSENISKETQKKVENIVKDEEVKTEDVEKDNVGDKEKELEKKICELEKNSKKLEDKANEYLELAQRKQAEFENYRKRTKKSEKEAKQNGIIEAVEKFLPVLDSFYMAQNQETNEEYIKNNSMIINQLNKALEDLGVKKIETNGQFDYNLHNAIMTDNVEGVEDNEILQVFQEGYILKDTVIRHSVVKINKK